MYSERDEHTFPPLEVMNAFIAAFLSVFVLENPAISAKVSLKWSSRMFDKPPCYDSMSLVFGPILMRLYPSYAPRLRFADA